MSTKYFGNLSTSVPAVPTGILDSVLNGLVVNDTNPHNGQTFTADQIQDIGSHCIWTAGASTPLGTFQAQMSNDGGTTWVNITGASAPLSGNSGSAAITVVDFPFALYRVVLTLTGGTVTVAHWFSGKGF